MYNRKIKETFEYYKTYIKKYNVINKISKAQQNSFQE
jgi:hypothetical protein